MAAQPRARRRSLEDGAVGRDVDGVSRASGDEHAERLAAADPGGLQPGAAGQADGEEAERRMPRRAADVRGDRRGRGRADPLAKRGGLLLARRRAGSLARERLLCVGPDEDLARVELARGKDRLLRELLRELRVSL